MSSRDMSAANWARTYPRLMRNIEELRELDCQVVTPPDFDKPPSKRLRTGGVVTGVAVILGEHGPEVLVDRHGRPL